MSMELIGVTAIACGLSGFIWTDPRVVLRLSSAACALWILYYLALGAWAPAVATTFGMIRFLSGAFAQKRMMWTVVIVCTALGTPLVLWSSPDVLGLVVALGSALKGVSVMLRDKPIMFRFVFCGGELCYLTFGIAAAAISGIAWSVLAILMCLGSAAVIRTRTSRDDTSPRTEAKPG